MLAHVCGFQIVRDLMPAKNLRKDDEARCRRRAGVRATRGRAASTMTVRGLTFAVCLVLALTGAVARADDAERTEVRAESGSRRRAASDSSPGVFPRVSRPARREACLLYTSPSPRDS